MDKLRRSLEWIKRLSRQQRRRTINTLRPKSILGTDSSPDFSLMAAAQPILTP